MKKFAKENNLVTISSPLGENIYHSSSPLGGEDKGEGYNNIANCNHPQPNLLPSREKETGRSMIEMLGVLAIIGVLSVGGIAGYSKAMYRYRLNKTIEQITMIAGNIRAYFGPQKSYAGLCSSDSCWDSKNQSDYNGNALLQKAKLVPEDMWDGNSIMNPFDGRLYITTTYRIDNYFCRFNDPNCPDQAFQIQTGNIPEEACIDLLTQDWSNIGASHVAITGAGPFGGYKFKLPVSLETAVDKCTRSAAETKQMMGYINLGISIFFDVDTSTGITWAN